MHVGLNPATEFIEWVVVTVRRPNFDDLCPDDGNVDTKRRRHPALKFSIRSDGEIARRGI